MYMNISCRIANANTQCGRIKYLLKEMNNMFKMIFNCILIELLLLNVFLLYGCSYDKSIQGIRVPPVIFSSLHNHKIKDVDYCKLLDNSLRKDSASLNMFVTLDCFDGEAGYCHGTIIVEIIERIGEECFIYSTHSLPINKRKEILSYIDVGIAYRYDNVDSRTTKDVFPKVFSVLSSNEEKN